MLKIYNTLSRQKETFLPLEEGKVGIYVCGLTVQNYSHIGHIRSAVAYDVIRRYLEYRGYDVTYVQNFTDINEKIVERAREEGLTAEELAEKYTQAYLEDIEQLNVKRASHYVKATENIDAIIGMIETLLEKGYAYEVNGNVYFSVENYEDYGKLSGRSLEDMQAGARIDIVEEKKNPLDFALWKKAPEGEKDWESPWGRGWPGWHIECSAMSMKYLGKSFDIHGGGADLIFPHHENEIAQSEACSGHKPFAKYWVHNGPVNLKGEKMSKSVGNFYTTRELLEKYRGVEVRYYLLTKHYRSPIDFSLEELEEAGTSLKRITNTINNLRRLLNTKVDIENKKAGEGEKLPDLAAIKDEFLQAMDDDFNTARAIGVVHDFVTAVNRLVNVQDFVLTESNYSFIKEADAIFTEILGILGLDVREADTQTAGEGLHEPLIELLLEVREMARQKKDWAVADRIRDGLNELGIIVRDTPQGVIWEKERG